MKVGFSFLLVCFLMVSCGKKTSIQERAEAGDAKAQFKLAEMFYSGNGVAKDNIRATKWARRSAEQGHAEAQALFGMMLLGGKGVPKDRAEGVKWIRKSAEQGLAVGQIALGRSYISGTGVPEDPFEAMKWFSKAAEQGNAEGKQWLEENPKISQLVKRAKNGDAEAQEMMRVMSEVAEREWLEENANN